MMKKTCLFLGALALCATTTFAQEQKKEAVAKRSRDDGDYDDKGYYTGDYMEPLTMKTNTEEE